MKLRELSANHLTAITEIMGPRMPTINDLREKRKLRAFALASDKILIKIILALIRAQPRVHAINAARASHPSVMDDRSDAVEFRAVE